MELSNTIYSKIREQLRKDILFRRFEPGRRLKIAELTNLYNVSQMPIREALQQLQGEGLIIIEPHKGAYVRKVDREFVSNIYDIRRVIEVFLTQQSLRSITDKDIHQLEKIQQYYERAVAKEDVGALLNYNKQFHTAIYKLAHNEEAMRIIEGHWQLINGLRLSFSPKADRMKEIIQEHRDILQALSARDEALLTSAAVTHCLKAKADLLGEMGD